MISEKNIPLPKEIVKQKLRERKKLSKQLLKEKRARLLVKNLSFKVTEEQLKELFGQYGEISSIELLKKPDGKLVGCGFIQFKLVQKAAKARHHTNGKHLLGRKLEVDFAKPKNKFKKETENLKKLEEKNSEDIMVSNLTKENDIKMEVESISENSENNDINSEHSEIEENIESESDEENIMDDSEDKDKNNPHFSHDISEGKTVFVKNVPFNAINEDLKTCMLQYGRIYYSLICIDKLTEHSKGTAFVKFVVMNEKLHFSYTK